MSANGIQASGGKSAPCITYMLYNRESDVKPQFSLKGQRFRLGSYDAIQE